MSFCALQFPDAAGYVGFANLPNQVHRKSVKKGFEFTLMVVGEWSVFSFNVHFMITDELFILRLELYFQFSLVFRRVWFGQIDTYKQPVSHWSLPWTLHPWCRRYTPQYTHTGMDIHKYTHCSNKNMSAAMSPAEQYFKRNVGNALVSKYDPALLMTWLRLGLVLAWKQLSRPALVSLCR